MTDADTGEPPLSLREYDRRDADAVWRLHELALRDAGTDPADVPGTDDLRDVETAYLDVGGAFFVGTVPAAAAGEEVRDVEPTADFEGLVERIRDRAGR